MRTAPPIELSVKERTKEIGTRKALGARRRTILLQFLIESTALCLVGGFIGLIFGPLLVNYIIVLFKIYMNEFGKAKDNTLAEPTNT